ncbi:TPA: hypothetical protein TVE76_001501 [Streptococcus equi subsp. zooepidemicus]|nr:hypothetical protein [Streptococcus equi subsp. zooepidemicus]
MIAIEMILTGQEPIRALKKELDRRLVQSICAPLTLGRLHALQRRYDSEVSRIATDTADHIQIIVNQLDSSIRGQGRTALERAIKTQNRGYSSLM